MYRFTLNAIKYAASPPIVRLDSFILFATDATPRVDFPAHEAGDLLILIINNQTNGTVATVPGGSNWTIASTNVINDFGERASIVAYQYALSSGTVMGDWGGIGSGAEIFASMSFKNARIGAISFAYNPATVGIPAVSLQETNGSSMVAGFIGSSPSGTNLSTAGDPTGMDTYAAMPAGPYVARGRTYISENKVNDWPVAGISGASNSGQIYCYGIEIKQA